MLEDDVKIYGNDSDRQNSDLNRVLESMREHRQNGNIDKAKNLGRDLVNIEIDFEKEIAPKFLKPDIIYQMKVMLVFAAEANLQMLVYEPLLSTTAINAMYDEIQSKENGFYKNISDGIAFSFYYAAIKGNDDIAHSMGKTFAMLCSAEGNEDFAEAGTLIYKKAVEIIEDEISKAEFKLI